MGKNGTSDFIDCTGWAWHGESHPKVRDPRRPKETSKAGRSWAKTTAEGSPGKVRILLCYSMVGVAVHMMISRNIVVRNDQMIIKLLDGEL